MTRRIAVAILLTVWAILIAAGVATYVTTRSILLSNLDASIVERAAAVPEIIDETGHTYRNTGQIGPGDTFIIRNGINQTINRDEDDRTRAAAPSPRPEILGAAFVTTQGGERFRTLTLKAYVKPASAAISNPALVPVTIVYRGSSERFHSVTRTLGLTLIACGAAGGVLSALVAWLVARAALRPLRSTAEVIGAINERALDRRIQTDRLPPELLPVGTKLNGMLQRLEESFAHRRRFLADAAHELRTPVAAVITTMEVTLRRTRDAEAYRAALEACLADARLLRSLVESLMTQARSELPVFNEPAAEVEVDQLVEDTIVALSALAEQREVRLENRTRSQDGAPVGAPLTLRTQTGRLRSVLLNLIGNAIEHNRRGGVVTVTVGVDQTNVRLAVADTGPGIAPQHLPHVFEPFYRADKARSPGEGHLGLGLFLVKTHVEALGGRCVVRSDLGVGTTFELLLPKSLVVRYENDMLLATEARRA